MSEPETTPSKNAPDKAERQALGRRLAAARELKNFSQQYIADQLGVEKATISAWEGGRNMPNPFALRAMAKLYGQSVDALLWDGALSAEALMIAARFDALTDSQQKKLEALWMAFITDSATDAQVEAKMPITAASKDVNA